jgi:hypothetical protein
MGRQSSAQAPDGAGEAVRGVSPVRHIYCRHVGRDRKGRWPDRSRLPVELRETEAEAVVWLVCQRNGVKRALKTISVRSSVGSIWRRSACTRSSRRRIGWSRGRSRRSGHNALLEAGQSRQRVV